MNTALALIASCFGAAVAQTALKGTYTNDVSWRYDMCDSGARAETSTNIFLFSGEPTIKTMKGATDGVDYEVTTYSSSDVECIDKGSGECTDALKTQCLLAYTYNSNTWGTLTEYSCKDLSTLPATGGFGAASSKTTDCTSKTTLLSSGVGAAATAAGGLFAALAVGLTLTGSARP